MPYTLVISFIEVCPLSQNHFITLRRVSSTGLDTTCIFLATRENKSLSKLVKVGKVGFHARLKDLHRSNPFSSSLALINDEHSIPDAWYELAKYLSRIH